MIIPGCDDHEAHVDGLIRRSSTGKILSQSVASNGVPKVNIGTSTRMVRDLIARAFHGSPLTKGYRVENANGDASDNRACNLVWSGASRGMQAPPPNYELLEKEYNRLTNERHALIELMQT